MRKIKYIDIGVEKIDKIYHIADVHVRNVKRHKEYELVLDNPVYQKLGIDTWTFLQPPHQKL